MDPFNQALKKNSLHSRRDIEQALLALIAPVYQVMKEQKTPGRFHLSDSGAVYDRSRQDIEGFLRTLWGVGPLCATKEKAAEFNEYFAAANEGILAGCNPNSPYYWGQLEDYDQLFVEMGALATYLLLTKDHFWDTLSVLEKEQLHSWMMQINTHKIPNTNWLFFRILVNTFCQQAGLLFPHEQLQADLAAIETYYLAEGWYFDGYENQIDYYIPFALQYYPLLFSVLTPNQSSPTVSNYRKRGAIFAKHFKNWFTNQGAALPFGRSQTYRFAQSAYFAAAAFAHIEFTDFSLAEAKYLLLANMRHWFAQPIFTEEGFLSIGYHYPNLVMAEGYNAPGSPYWALKNFIVLALPEADPFWQVEAIQPTFDAKTRNPYSRMLLIHSETGNELQAFTCGQHSHEHAHGESKYEKFVYSATFGFSVAKGSVLPKQGAFDNTLAISETTTHYRTVFGYEDYQICDEYTYGRWQPWEDCQIDSFIIPCYPWHLRLHIVETKRRVNLLAGSFSAPDYGESLIESIDEIRYRSKVGTIGIKIFTPTDKLELTRPEPNTNLLFEKTVLPQAAYKLALGRHVILLACLGQGGNAANSPQLLNARLEGSQLVWQMGQQDYRLSLSQLATIN